MTLHGILYTGILLTLLGYLTQQFVAHDVAGVRGRRKARLAAESESTTGHTGWLASVAALPEPEWSKPRLSLAPEHCGLVPLTEAEWLDWLAEPYDYERQGI